MTHQCHQNHQNQQKSKVNLFKTLLISWLIGISLSYFKDVDMNYGLKCLLMAMAYLFSSAFCYRYLKKQIELKVNAAAYVISALCICMLISCLFNVLFIDPDFYYALIEIKQGGGISWRLIYQSIEIIALITVGKNGIICGHRWVACRGGWLNVIITNNSYNCNGR